MTNVPYQRMTLLKLDLAASCCAFIESCFVLLKIQARNGHACEHVMLTLKRFARLLSHFENGDKRFCVKYS
jgi:hypothetical protein